MITLSPSDSPERLTLALEIAEAEGIPLAQALDAAALEEATLTAYALVWNSQARQAARDLLIYAAQWNADAAAGRIALAHEEVASS